ncbi:hypothetical protein M0R88_12795 [Halorussus gelatinilyticus]|uniref:DUF7322 domain-containing protein n=1 Tax=Halorussus gelatinilyticus TaxID=2937524 RepID=A0A8U0IH50_9EURY|nr:hypothetical protein [Halorussus gelatinilyticus]UPV99398.1 hypothetical protein M0R88_12795 [Halorussus gelatinilyticus]
MASDDSTPDDSDDSVAELLPEDPPQAEADLLPDDPSADLGPDPPRVPDTSQSEADAELKRRFWSLVFVFNVALFGVSLGLMLVAFEGRLRLGGAMVAVGAVAFLRGWRGYRKARSDADDGADDEPDAEGDDEADTDASESSEPDDSDASSSADSGSAGLDDLDAAGSDDAETTDGELQKD